MNFDEVDLYTISIDINRKEMVSLLVFADPLYFEQDMVTYYYEKYHKIQPNLTKYNFQYIGRFNPDGEYFDLSCNALQYSLKYS